MDKTSVTKSALAAAVLGALLATSAQAVPLLRTPNSDLSVQRDSPGAADFRAGVQALLRNDLVAARNSFVRANKLSPTAAEPMLGLADVALRNNNAPLALDWLQKAKTAVPNNPAVWLGLGRYYRSQRNLKLAEEHLRAAVKLGVPAAPAHAELGDLLLEKGDPTGAVNEFRTAVSIRPNDAFALYGLGVALSATKQTNAALLALERAAKQAPGDFAPLRALARLHGEQNRFDQALKYADLALKAAPAMVDLQMDRIDILSALGRRADALTASRQTVAKNGAVPAAHFQLGGLLLQASDWKSAETAFRQTLKLDSKNVMAANNVAYLTMQRKGDLNEALQLAQAAVAQEPGNAMFLDTLAGILQARGDDSGAIEATNRAIKANPKSGESFFRLGVLQAKAGKKSEAIKAFDSALAAGLPAKSAAEAKSHLAQLRAK